MRVLCGETEMLMSLIYLSASKFNNCCFLKHSIIKLPDLNLASFLTSPAQPWLFFFSSMNGENHSRNPLLCFMLHFYSSVYPQMRVKLCFNNRYQISPVSQYTSKGKININLQNLLALHYSTCFFAIGIHSKKNIHTLQDTLKIRRYWIRDQIQCNI